MVKKIKIISHESQITVNYFSSTSRKFSLKKVIKKYNRFHFRFGGKSSSVIGGDAAQVREGSGVSLSKALWVGARRLGPDLQRSRPTTRGRQRRTPDYLHRIQIHLLSSLTSLPVLTSCQLTAALLCFCVFFIHFSFLQGCCESERIKGSAGRSSSSAKHRPPP